MPDGTAYDPYPGQTSTTGGTGTTGNSNNNNGTYQGGNTGYNWSGYKEWLEMTKNSTKTCNLIVNYFANGYNGSAAENPPSSSVRSYTGQSVDVYLAVTVASGETMSNPGYVFVGWATTDSSQTIAYNPGDTISAYWWSEYRGNSVVDLYAVWTNQNVITYHPDDNSREQSDIYQVKESGQAATLKSATFTRTGYTQVGWSTTKGGSKNYDLGGTYSSDAALELYPVWQANTYTVTYLANQGTGTMAVQTITYDSTFTPSECTFTREGYSFFSWNESADGKGIRWKVQEYTVNRAEDIILYAIWRGNEYTISYNDNCSGAASGSMPSSTAVFGDPFITRRNQFTRFGLTFTGWNTSPDGTGDDWLPSGVAMDTYKRTASGIWDVSHNVTLYAQWDPTIYPYGTVFFNGKNAKDMGIIVEELPSYYYAERAFNHKQVNGKNGDVILDSGRYENVKKVYKVACYDPSRNFYESAVALSTFLHSSGSEYIRLEDSYEPTSYRMAIYEEMNEIENILGKAGKCDITFNCMPQRFLLSGDEEINIPSSGYTIYNPTAFDAKPLIRIQGVGTVTVNGRRVTVTDNDNDMLVDCETQNAKDLSGADMNYFIYCDEFPVLSPGFNTIVFEETIDAVKITPRWWIL